MIHRLKDYLKKMGPAWIIRTTEEHLGKTWAWILTIDALIATWLAAMGMLTLLVTTFLAFRFVLTKLSG